MSERGVAMKKILFKVMKDCVIFKFIQEKYDKADLNDFISFIGKKLEEEKITNAVVDFRQVKYRMPVMDVFELSARVARLWGNKYKVAALTNREFSRFGETVAKNRGAEVFISPDFKEIRNWFRKQ